MQTWFPSSNIHSVEFGAASATCAACSQGTRRSCLPKTTSSGWRTLSATPTSEIRRALANVSSSVVAPLWCMNAARELGGRFGTITP